MRRRLLASYLTVTLVTLLVLVYPLGLTFASREEGRLLRDIEHDATVIAGLSEDALERHTRPDVGAVLASYARDPGGRIVVIGRDGRSIADSESTAQVGVDFTNRPEVATAIGGGRAEGRRRSDTLGADLLYVAVPVASSGVVHGVVRITYPASTLDRRVRTVWIGLAALSATVAGVVTIVGFALARMVTRPVDQLEAVARRVATGDLSARAPTDVGAPELRELAATFNQTVERLGEVLDSQQAFVADASHQLRTPLAALRLQLENIESAAPLELQPALATARAETARLRRLADALLSLVRSSGAAAPRKAVDVSAIAAERHQTWSPIAEDGGVALELSGPQHAWVAAVPGALEQILDNLVDNALDVAPSNSTVRVEIAPFADRVELHVTDEGPGLSEDDRRRAFDRFWRSTTAPPGGTGLGLAIVAQLVSASGGTVALREASGGGIDAVVRLRPADPPEVV